MTDIRDYLKAKERREQNQEHYKAKIRRHRLTAFYRVLLVALALGILVVVVWLQHKNHIYTEYEIVRTLERESAGGATQIRLGDAVLTYSKDGAHCTNLKGETLWNQTYEMQDILLAVCGDVLAIGEDNGRNIYVQSSKEKIGSFSANMPIRNLAVSAAGKTAVVMADTDSAYLKIYSPEGEGLGEGEATMEQSGYPLALSLSPNGELMAVSYLYLDAGIQKTHIAFYNLGEVGGNFTDCLVSAYHYSDLFVPTVIFADDDTAFAVGDSRLMFYQGSQQPKSAGEFLFSGREVRSVFYSDKYVGLVFYSTQGEHLYEMEVYGMNAKRIGSYGFDTEYTDIFFEKDSFVIYNETECMIITLEGIVKYQGSFHKPVRLMLPAGLPYQYQLLTSRSADTIRLK
ncbi:MAG: DUF5711 family protein [Clostridium sp.]|nr:DUF5711 family protein [Clostridium sp.]